MIRHEPPRLSQLSSQERGSLREARTRKQQRLMGTGALFTVGVGASIATGLAYNHINTAPEKPEQQTVASWSDQAPMQEGDSVIEVATELTGEITAKHNISPEAIDDTVAAAKDAATTFRLAAGRQEAAGDYVTVTIDKDESGDYDSSVTVTRPAD